MAKISPSFALLATCAICGLGSDLAAQPFDLEYLRDGWGVAPNTDSATCTLIRPYDDGTFFGAIYDAREQVVNLSLENEFATSLSHGQNIRLDMIMFTSIRNSTEEGWHGLSYFVSVAEDGSRAFYSERLNAEVLDDLARHSTVGWTYRGNVVQSLALDGSSRAIEALRDCAFRVAGLNRMDPFLN